MRLSAPFVIAALLLGSAPLAPAAAGDRTRYEHNGKYYNSYAQCRREKRRAAKRGTAIGAVGVGVGAAVLGGNVGESLLAAGVGAVAGNVIGGKTKRC